MYGFFQKMHNFIRIVIPLIDNFGIFISLCCLMHSDFKRAILIIILEKKYSKLSTTYRLKLGCSLSGNQPTCSKIYMYGKIIYILPKFNAISMSNIQPCCCTILSKYGRRQVGKSLFRNKWFVLNAMFSLCMPWSMSTQIRVLIYKRKSKECTK